MALSKPRNVGSYVEEMLQCSVCLDTVREPQTLQNCLHSYCKECTDQLQHKQNNHPPGVKCPLCGQFSGKDEIRHNFFIKDLAEMHRSAHQDQHKECEQCDGVHSNNQTCWKCLDCRMVLCDSCKKGHLKIKMLQDHRVVAVTSDEEADLVIDQLVFCSVHQNKPIELYCKTCNIPICIKCRLTTHDEHKSESIEEALEKIVPEIQESTKYIDANMESTKEAIGKIKDKIDQSKKQFKICHKKVNETTEERIKDIQMEQRRLNDKLTQQENQEVEKLEIVKKNLEKKLKEGELLKRVVLTSLDKARHATLLTELVQGGLWNKIKSMSTEPHLPMECKVNMPIFEVNTLEWKNIKKEGLFGKCIMNIAILSIAMCNVLPKQYTSAKKWSGSFKQYLDKPLQQILKINLPGECYKLNIIQDQIWVPQFYKSINLYSKTGQLLKTINIDKPAAVEEAYNGDIFVACHSGSGLHIITDNNNPVKLCNGHFSDVCSLSDKVYALDYNTKSVFQFCHTDNAGNIKSMKWTQVRQIPLYNCTHLYSLDTLIVTNQTQDPTLKYFYVSAWINKTTFQYNEQGQQIQQFGSHNGQDEVKLSYPYLCGVDSQSHLLVADSGNHIYKILDPESGQWSDTGIRRQEEVYDAKFDSDGNLWLAQNDGTGHIITKHIHK